jgi:hypothetical protein
MGCKQRAQRIFYRLLTERKTENLHSEKISLTAEIAENPEIFFEKTAGTLFLTCIIPFPVESIYQGSFLFIALDRHGGFSTLVRFIFSRNLLFQFIQRGQDGNDCLPQRLMIPFHDLPYFGNTHAFILVNQDVAESRDRQGSAGCSFR